MCSLVGGMCRECAVWWEGCVEDVQFVGGMCRECAVCWEGCVENVQFVGRGV
jgi:hypothetical protein